MIKNIPFLIMIAFAIASCESSPIENEVFTIDNENEEIETAEKEDLEIIDIHEDNQYGLGE